ncbi:MAG: hypothetical protein K9L64_03960 [Candidatus Izimaplasma sp.]|nr:hypothetical protein [Candidatus Izimaplasma bacterium]
MTPVMYVDPSGEFFISAFVIGLVVFAAYSTSPQIQKGVAEISTVTNICGSIATGSFVFGKAVWSKSIFIGLKQSGEVNDIYGNTIDNIFSSIIFDAGIPYFEHYLNDDGTKRSNLGASLYGVYIQVGWSDEGFRIDGGLAINLKYGIGLSGGSKTIDFNLIGYFWDKIFE